PSFIYTLSLHDALPIYQSGSSYQVVRFADDFCIHITLCDHHIQMHEPVEFWLTMEHDAWKDTITLLLASYPAIETDWNLDAYKRSEEHTSELQSRSDLV